MVLLFWTKILLAAPLVIKLSHVTGENTPKNLSALKFKEIVERKLRGRVEIQVFPNSQLFGDAKELEALLLNDVHWISYLEQCQVIQKSRHLKQQCPRHRPSFQLVKIAHQAKIQCLSGSIHN